LRSNCFFKLPSGAEPRRSAFYDTPETRARDLSIVAEMKTICDEFEAYGYRRIDYAIVALS
jgi:hypothetical protein